MTLNAICTTLGMMTEYEQQQQQQGGLSGWWAGLQERFGMYALVEEMSETLESFQEQMEAVQHELVAKASRHPQLSSALGPGIVAEPYTVVSET
jgi:hypothetical protein